MELFGLGFDGFFFFILFTVYVMGLSLGITTIILETLRAAKSSQINIKLERRRVSIRKPLYFAVGGFITLTFCGILGQTIGIQYENTGSAVSLGISIFVTVAVISLSIARAGYAIGYRLPELIKEARKEYLT